MTEKIYKTESVEHGNKANWPNQTDYIEPTRSGYIFNGWDYDWKNKAITADTDIHPIWEGYSVVADTNHTLISGDGDSSTDPTKMFYYIRTDSGRMLPDNVVFEKVPLASDELEIQFTDNGVSKEDNKNVKKVTVKENDVNKNRFYRFKAKYTNDNIYSDVCELKQVGKEQILLPPFDYLTFTYSWTEADGQDLDSATMVRNSGIKIDDSHTLDDYYVGYGGDGSDNATVANYIRYGGDNQNTGDEGALINWKDILATKDYITEGINTLYLDIYANWFEERKNGNMSITFNTYKGDDGMIQDGYVFKPNGNTVLVSTKTLENLNTYAEGGINAVRPTNIMTKVYSKMATVEYDIRSKAAVLIGNYTQSGRRLEITYNFDGKDKQAETYSLPNFDNKSHSGVVSIGRIKYSLNGVINYLDFDLNTINLKVTYAAGAIENCFYYEIYSDGYGGLLLNYNLAAYSPPYTEEGEKRSYRYINVRIDLPYDETIYDSLYVKINFYQNK